MNICKHLDEFEATYNSSMVCYARHEGCFVTGSCICVAVDVLKTKLFQSCDQLMYGISMQGACAASSFPYTLIDDFAI